MNEYKLQLLEDLKEWAAEGNAENLTLDEVRERLQDPSYTDSITGNASGSYYCNTYKAQEMINTSGILWAEEFLDYLAELDMPLGALMKRGAECVDVWAREFTLERLTDEELAQVLAGEEA